MLTKVYRFFKLPRICEELILLLLFVAWYLYHPNFESLRRKHHEFRDFVNLDWLCWTGQTTIDLICLGLYQNYCNKMHKFRSSVLHDTRINLTSFEKANRAWKLDGHMAEIDLLQLGYDLETPSFITIFLKTKWKSLRTLPRKWAHLLTLIVYSGFPPSKTEINPWQHKKYQYGSTQERIPPLDAA